MHIVSTINGCCCSLSICVEVLLLLMMIMTFPYKLIIAYPLRISEMLLAIQLSIERVDKEVKE